MRQLGTHIVVTTFLLMSVNALAQEAAAPAASAPTAVTSSAPAGSVDIRSYRGLGIKLSGGVNAMSSAITGTGMNSKTPTTTGTTYGAGLTYGMEMPVVMFAQYQIYTAKHQDVSGVRPNSFNTTHTRTDVGFWARESVSQSEGFYRAGLGYFFENRESDRVSPAVVAGQQLSGPSALLGFTSGAGGKTFFETDLIFSFPNAFKEQNTVTGQYAFGLSTQLAIKVVYSYTEQLDVSLGLLGKYDMVTFSGTSSGADRRGVSDATETFLNVAVPLELRFKF